MSSLLEASARRDRAGKHLQDLISLCREFESEEMAKATIELNPDSNVPWVFGRPDSPIPMEIPLLTGEVLEHLRASLDYLVYQLASHGSKGKPFKEHRIQFPIEDEEEKFERKRNDRLHMVVDDHVAIIKSLQPFKGCKWTGNLRDLVDSHKHRLLVVTKQNTNLTLEKILGPKLSETGARSVTIRTSAVIRMSLEDGSDLTDELASLHVQVGSVIQTFAALLGEVPNHHDS